MRMVKLDMPGVFLRISGFWYRKVSHASSQMSRLEEPSYELYSKLLQGGLYGGLYGGVLQIRNLSRGILGV